MGRNPPALKLYSSCALRTERSPLIPLYPLGGAISTPRYAGKNEFRHSSVNQFFETSLAEQSDRNDRATSTKDGDERNCPEGIAQQCRSDPHAHSHDEHDYGRNNGNKPVHFAP
jgi:hypothetical protein